jgi:predicted amidohydrolase
MSNSHEQQASPAASPRTIRVAAVQMVSTPRLEDNIETARRLIENAVRNHGAQLVCLPEYWPIFGNKETDKLTVGEEYDSQGPIQEFLRNSARHHGIWLLGGTIPLIAERLMPEEEVEFTTQVPGAKCKKVFNTLLVYDPQGHIVSRYDKIHLFNYSHGMESYAEGRTMAAGDPNGIKTVDIPGVGTVGLSICYDLRFPELYRAMSRCNLIVAPSAFTYPTGEAHWELLLRARAVENQCYLLAGTQGGEHENKRRTWGHSMLVDPWGKVVAEKREDGEGIVVGEIDLDVIENVRQRLPALDNRVL